MDEDPLIIAFALFQGDNFSGGHAAGACDREVAASKYLGHGLANEGDDVYSWMQVGICHLIADLLVEAVWFII